MKITFFRYSFACISLTILVLATLSCNQSPDSIEPSPSPTSAVPGYSLGNPAPFGEALIHQIGGIPEQNIDHSNYMEIRPDPDKFMGPDEFKGNTDIFVISAWPYQDGNDPPEAGNEYVLVMLSFHCITGIGEENNCEVFTLFNIIDSNGKRYNQELRLWSEVVDWHFLNMADEYILNEGESFSGAAIFEVDMNAEGLILVYDSPTHPLYWKLPKMGE